MVRIGVISQRRDHIGIIALEQATIGLVRNDDVGRPFQTQYTGRRRDP